MRTGAVDLEFTNGEISGVAVPISEVSNQAEMASRYS